MSSIQAQNILNNLKRYLALVVNDANQYLHPVEDLHEIYEAEKTDVISAGIWVEKVLVKDHKITFVFPVIEDPVKNKLKNDASEKIYNVFSNRDYSKVVRNGSDVEIIFGNTGDAESDKALPVILACFLIEMGLPVDMSAYIVEKY